MNIELGRLRRAIWLEVEPLGIGHCYHVSGGARRHLVNLETGECECWDYLYRGALCSHLLAAALREGEPSVLRALRELVDRPQSLPRPGARRLVGKAA